jgi:drug/metabolite transporter (DMT)-like permease
MIWLPLAFLTAFFEALKDVGVKHNVRGVPATVVAWAWVFFALPFLGIAVLLGPPVVLDNSFWLALLVGGSLNVAAISLYVQALRLGDLSTTVPMIAFTPLFLLMTAPLIVGEFPDAWGVAGVALIVAGSYVLNIQDRQHGYLAPYRALLRQRGPQLMLIVALLWSFTATIDKIGVQSSAPLFWITSMNTFVTVALTPLVLRTPTNAALIRKNWPALLSTGLFSALALSFQMIALTMTLVAYVIAIKRTSTLMGVLFGALIFKEIGLRERLTGAAIMLLGVLCITLPS